MEVLKALLSSQKNVSAFYSIFVL